MPRLIGKALEYDIANTIVEDSEPERAAEAAKEKEVRRGRKKRKQEQIRENKTNRMDSSHTIVVPDIMPGSFSLKSSKCICHCLLILSIVNSSEKSLEKECCDDFAKAENTDVIEDRVAKYPTAAPDDPSIILTPITLTIRQGTPHDAEESNFKRFVTRYTLPPAASHKPLTLNSNLNPKMIKTTTNKIKKSSSASFSCLTSLTKNQLAKLNRCYICNLTWTARKTIPTKLRHIQSCAKKHGWSEETLIAVFNKELHTAELPESNNPLPDSVTSLETSHSLLENIKDGTAAHRKQLKGRSQQKSILDPTRAHSAIVERAKNLFGTSDQHSGQLSETADGLPSTQAFQPSKFDAVTQGLFARAMLEENERCDIPATQKFESRKSCLLLSGSTNSVSVFYLS